MASDQSEDEAQQTVSASDDSDDGSQMERSGNGNDCKTGNVETNVGVSTTPKMLIMAKEQLKEIIGQMPDDKKAVYAEALLKIPHIMATESDPLSFLRVENFDLHATANRLALYWDARKTIFGVDRAFRPVKTLTTDTALAVSTQELLHCGALAELPKDRMGRTVLYFDTDKLKQNFANKSTQPSQAISEALFYMLDTVSARNSKTQSEGLVLLIALADVEYFYEQSAVVKDLLKVALKALPIKMHAVHLCRVKLSLENEKEIVERIADEFKSCLEVDKETCGVELHYLPSSDLIRNRLEPFGLLEMFLPQYVGGTVEPSNYIRVPGTAQTDPSTSLGRGSVVSEEDAARLEERRKRKRKSDALYARRKRMREKQQEKELQEKCLELSKANMQLDRESRQLEDLLQKAKAQLRASESSSSNQVANAPLPSHLPLVPHQLSGLTSPDSALATTQLFSLLQEHSSAIPTPPASSSPPTNNLFDTLRLFGNGIFPGATTGISQGFNQIPSKLEPQTPQSDPIQSLLAASAGAAGQTPQALYMRAKELIKNEHRTELLDQKGIDKTSGIGSSNALQDQLIQLLSCLHGPSQNSSQALQLHTIAPGGHLFPPTATNAGSSKQATIPSNSESSVDPQSSVVLQALLQSFLVGVSASSNQKQFSTVPPATLLQECFKAQQPINQSIFPNVQHPLNQTPSLLLSDIQKLFAGGLPALSSPTSSSQSCVQSDDNTARSFLLNALCRPSVPQQGPQASDNCGALRRNSLAQSSGSTNDAFSILQSILDAQANRCGLVVPKHNSPPSSKLLQEFKPSFAIEAVQNQLLQQPAQSSTSTGRLPEPASSAEQTIQYLEIAAALKSLLAAQENRVP